ncbi:GNAT family N-acetyltransferase [Xanthomonas cerealis pv. cerealis]|nr:GNAT family N-acetyltransferase [Xanthomonas translucens pv. pistacia]
MRGFGVADLAGSEIDGLFIDPDWRGSGPGRRLHAREVKLVPGARGHLAAALNAVAFYQAQGYAGCRATRSARRMWCMSPTALVRLPSPPAASYRDRVHPTCRACPSDRPSASFPRRCPPTNWSACARWPNWACWIRRRSRYSTT